MYFKNALRLCSFRYMTEKKDITYSFEMLSVPLSVSYTISLLFIVFEKNLSDANCRLFLYKL